MTSTRVELAGAVLVLTALLGAPARAALDPLCGTTITAATHPSLTVTLTQDLDCSGLTGNALTVGASGVTIDGGPSHYKIIAPDAARAITSTGFSNVTVKRTEVSGWCGGVGVYLDGGSGHTVDDVTISARATGVDARNTSNLTLSHLVVDSAATSGVTLTSVTLPLTLRDLSLTNSLTGLTLTTFAGAVGSPYVIGLYDAQTQSGAVTSLAGNDTSIALATASNLRLEGLRLDGSTYGVNATTGTNANLVFKSLDVSSFGVGQGIHVVGSGHLIEDVTANGRSNGVHTQTTTNLTVRRLHAKGAVSSALWLESPSLPLTLENLDLQNDSRAINLTGFTGDSSNPYVITAYDSGTGVGAIGSLEGSLTGIDISNSKYVTLRNLTLDNPTTAIYANATNNDTLRFESLDLSAPRIGGIGLYVGGKNITVANVTANRRTQGVYAYAVTNLTVTDLVARKSSTGLYLQGFTPAHAPCTLSRLTLTDDVTGLYFLSWSMPFTVRNTVGDSQALDFARSLTAIGVQSSSELTFADLVLPNASYGINAYPGNTSSTHLTFTRLDLSGDGSGTGLIAGGTTHVLSNVKANYRAIGVQLFNTAGTSITTLEAKKNRTAGLSLESTTTGAAPTLSGLTLTDNATGLQFNNWSLAFVVRNTAGDSQGLDVSGSDTGIYILNSANVTFRDLVLPNPANGILAWHSSRATSNSNMRFERLDLSGTRGAGSGLAVGGANHVITEVVADRRATGVFLGSTDNATIDGLTARNGGVGLSLTAIATAGWTGPSLSRLVLTNDTTGLSLNNVTRPTTVGPATPGATVGSVNVSGSGTGIACALSSSITFRNLVLDNPKYGFEASSNTNTSLTFTNVNASGKGLGTGILLGTDANWRAGTGHVLTDITANNRVTGVAMAYSSGAQLTRVTANQCDVGLLVDRPYDTSATLPTIATLTAQDCRVGLSVRWTNVATLALAGMGLDLARSFIGLEVANSTGLTVDGASGPQLGNLGNGVLASSGNASLTLKNLDVSGVGLGTGLAAGGTGLVLQNITANDRQIGVDLTTTTNPSLAGITSARSVTGLKLTATTVTTALAPTGLALTACTTGLSMATVTVSGAGSSFLVGPAMFSALASNPTAIAITSATGVTYDTAGLASTFGLANPSTGTYTSALVSGSALCGTTLDATSFPSLTLTLTSDLDCTGVGATGTALTIGASGFTIDGAKPGGGRWKIIAPNAGTVIGAVGKSNLTIRHLDLSGARVAGVGLSVSGGSGHVIDDVDVSRRATGADVRSASNVTVTNLVADRTQTVGLHLQSLTAPLVFGNLTLTNGAGVGLRLSSIDGTHGAANGIDDLTFDATALASLAGNDVSIRLEGSVTHVVFTDLPWLDGRGAGFDVNGVATNGSLVLRNLDASALRGAGTGIAVRGAGLVLDTIYANRRATGFDVQNATSPSLVALSASGATTSGATLQTVTPQLGLVGLSATDSAVGLTLTSVSGTTSAHMTVGPWTAGVGGVGPGTGAIKSVAGSTTGISVSGSSSYIDFVNLALDNYGTGLQAVAGTSSLGFAGLDVSGTRHAGTGLSVAGTSHSVTNVVANNRSTGVVVSSVGGLVLTDLAASHASTAGLSLQTFAPALAAPTIDRLTLTDNQQGLRFEVWTRTATVDPSWHLDTSDSATGIYVRVSSGLTFSGLTLPNPTAGIDAGSETNTGLSLTNVVASGSGRGYGIMLQGPNHTITGGSSSQRTWGVYARVAGNLAITGFTATRSDAGLALHSTTTGGAPTLRDLTLTDNGWGLYFDGWTQPTTLRATDNVDLSRSLIGLRILRSSDLVFENLVLPNPTAGVSADDANGNNARLTFTNVDASGPGTGTGIGVSYADHVLTNIVANDRDTGVNANFTSNLRVTNLVATHDGTGLKFNGNGATAPTLRGLTLTDCDKALLINGFALPLTITNAGATPTALDAARSNVGISLDTVTGVTVTDLTLDNVGHGIFVEPARVSSGLVFRRLDLSGTGLGNGLSGAGANATIDTVTANDRSYGVYATSASNLTVTGLTAARATTAALYVDPTAAGTKPTLSGLALTGSAVGLQLRNITGPLVVDGAAVTSLAGNQTALYLSDNVSGTTVRGLTLTSSSSGVNATSTGVAHRNLRFESLDVTGFCRGTGLALNGQDHVVSAVTAGRRGTGVSLGNGDRIAIDHSVIGANTTGLSITGTTLIPNTTVVTPVGTDIPNANSATVFKVASAANILAGMTLTIGAEDRTVASVTGSFVTLTAALTAGTPAAGTVVRGLLFGQTRVTMTTSDICANGTGANAGSVLTTATGNYWRSSLGMKHSSNPGCTTGAGCLGDTVTGTAITLSQFVTVPTDKSNAYCNQAPIADAGPDQAAACEGDTVTLDARTGVASYDPDVEPITFDWSQTAGQSVTLAGPTTAAPTFTAPGPAAGQSGASQVLSFGLIVRDDLVRRRDAVDVTVVRRNYPPTASAGADQAVVEGAAVALAGSGVDPEARPLGHRWTQVGGPAVTLSDDTTTTPSFTAPDIAGGAPGSVILSFRLTESDTAPPGYCGGDASASDTLDVVVANRVRPPTADAGDDRSVDEGTLVTLDGLASSDPDGDALSYAWTQLGGPSVALAGAATATPSFTAPEQGCLDATSYTFQLTVDDGFGGTSTDTVTIVVSDATPDGDGDGMVDCRDDCPADSDKIAPGACGCGVADTDADSDGTPDCHDGCAADPLKLEPGACGCGVADADSDADGAPDCHDGCAADPLKLEPGACGCGVADTDTDSDGTPDCHDACPDGALKTSPGVCGCDVLDTDTDHDGAPDCIDLCPADSDKIAPGLCGCGAADVDTDLDGTEDCHDGCAADPLKVVAGLCGCGIADTDTDLDGTEDCHDGCAADPLKVVAGLCGCGVADVDTDLDGTEDCHDGCAADPLKVVAGLCGCGVADVDTDLDGAEDCHDGCAADPLKVAAGLCGCGVADTDTDLDGAEDCHDGCVADPLKVEPGLCGCGTADADADLDGTPDCLDLCPADPLKVDAGLCGCGLADVDADGDAAPDCLDLCPLDRQKLVPGLCGCGVADADADGDRVPDCLDGCPANPDKAAPGVCGCELADLDVDRDGQMDCEDQCIAGSGAGCGGAPFFLTVRTPTGLGQIACTYDGTTVSCASADGVAVVTPATDATTCE